MSQLTHAVRRSPRRARLIAAALVFAFAALMLIWIGRASADAAGPTRAHAALKTVSNVATGRADAVDAVDEVCTESGQFVDMPGMSETFSFGGTASRPVIVLFQGNWLDFSEGTFAFLRLTIDGVPQSGPDFVVQHRSPGDPTVHETNGFNFISDPVTPGVHVARVQWRRSGIGAQVVCVRGRSLIILHK